MSPAVGRSFNGPGRMRGSEASPRTAGPEAPKYFRDPLMLWFEVGALRYVTGAGGAGQPERSRPGTEAVPRREAVRRATIGTMPKGRFQGEEHPREPRRRETRPMWHPRRVPPAPAWAGNPLLLGRTQGLKKQPRWGHSRSWPQRMSSPPGPGSPPSHPAQCGSCAWYTPTLTKARGVPLGRRPPKQHGHHTEHADVIGMRRRGRRWPRPQAGKRKALLPSGGHQADAEGTGPCGFEREGRLRGPRGLGREPQTWT